MSTTTGFDAAATIPVGATLTRVYFCEPDDYTPSSRHGEHDTYVEALEASIAAKQRVLAAAADTDRIVHERLTIDVRWLLAYPDGGSLDTVAQRTRYDNLAEAIEHAERIRKYAPTAGAAGRST